MEGGGAPRVFGIKWICYEVNDRFPFRTFSIDAVEQIVKRN